MAQQEISSDNTSVRLELEKWKHREIKQIRNAIQYQRGTDITLIDTYQLILQKGMEHLQKELDLQKNDVAA